MNKYINIANIVLVLFIISTIGDVVSTMMATDKHSDELETNPFNVWGLPLWALMVIKIIIYSLFFLMCTKAYKYGKVYLRYYLVFFLVLVVLIQIAVVTNNFMAYSQEPGSIRIPSEEERVDSYMNSIGDLEVMQTIEPAYNGFRIPLVIYLLFFNMVVFIVWVSFERRFDMYGLK